METLDIATSLNIVCLDALYSGSLTDNNQSAYDLITWTDSRDKPSWDEINTCMTTCPDINCYDWNGSAWVLNQSEADKINSAAIKALRNTYAICALDSKSKYDREQESIIEGVVVNNPMSKADYVLVLQYLQDLFELPQQSGFPWNGPEDPLCSWPTKPSCVEDTPLIGS